MNKTDQELVNQCLAGDTEGFKSLVSRYELRLIRFIRARTYGAIEADDVFQETMLNAYRFLASYQPQYKFSTWLFKIALSQISEKMRKLQETSDIYEHDIAVEDRDSTDNVWHLIRAKLDEQQFNLLWMMYVEGFTGAEIAKALEKSLPWVKVNLFRTKQQLKSMLTEHGYTLADCS